MSPKMPDLSDLIGVPFLDLGRDPSKGLDCWGLVMEVQRRMGRTVRDLAVPSCFDSEAAFDKMREATAQGGEWVAVSEPEPGDVAVMETNPQMPGCIDHCGVYLGSGRVIHAICKHEVSVFKVNHASLFGRLRGWYRWAA